MNNEKLTEVGIYYEKYIGEIKIGNKKRIIVRLKNLGESDLIIHKIQPSCQCVKVNNNMGVLKPKHDVEIIFEFHATEIGLNEESIAFNLNTKEKFNIIKFKAKVVK